jgi:hypothetical protein
MDTRRSIDILNSLINDVEVSRQLNDKVKQQIEQLNSRFQLPASFGKNIDIVGGGRQGKDFDHQAKISSIVDWMAKIDNRLKSDTISAADRDRLVTSNEVASVTLDAYKYGIGGFFNDETTMKVKAVSPIFNRYNIVPTQYDAGLTEFVNMFHVGLSSNELKDQLYNFMVNNKFKIRSDGEGESESNEFDETTFSKCIDECVTALSNLVFNSGVPFTTIVYIPKFLENVKHLINRVAMYADDEAADGDAGEEIVEPNKNSGSIGQYYHQFAQKTGRGSINNIVTISYSAGTNVNAIVFGQRFETRPEGDWVDTLFENIKDVIENKILNADKLVIIRNTKDLFSRSGGKLKDPRERSDRTQTIPFHDGNASDLFKAIGFVWNARSERAKEGDRVRVIGKEFAPKLVGNEIDFEQHEDWEDAKPKIQTQILDMRDQIDNEFIEKLSKEDSGDINLGNLDLSEYGIGGSWIFSAEMSDAWNIDAPESISKEDWDSVMGTPDKWQSEWPRKEGVRSLIAYANLYKYNNSNDHYELDPEMIKQYSYITATYVTNTSTHRTVTDDADVEVPDWINRKTMNLLDNFVETDMKTPGRFVIKSLYNDIDKFINKIYYAMRVMMVGNRRDVDEEKSARDRGYMGDVDRINWKVESVDKSSSAARNKINELAKSAFGSNWKKEAESESNKKSKLDLSDRISNLLSMVDKHRLSGSKEDASEALRVKNEVFKDYASAYLTNYFSGIGFGQAALADLREYLDNQMQNLGNINKQSWSDLSSAPLRDLLKKYSDSESEVNIDDIKGNIEAELDKQFEQAKKDFYDKIEWLRSQGDIITITKIIKGKLWVATVPGHYVKVMNSRKFADSDKRV